MVVADPEEEVAVEVVRAVVEEEEEEALGAEVEGEAFRDLRTHHERKEFEACDSQRTTQHPM